MTNGQLREQEAGAWPNDTANKEAGAANAWNLDVFVQTVHELNPNLAWKDVVRDFDHAEFFIRDKITFKQLINALRKVLKENFPIEHIYRVWKNPEAQVAFYIYEAISELKKNKIIN